MKAELIKIPLTPKQTESAEWMLGLPLFDETPESLAHNWDETPERAAQIVAAAKEVKIAESDLQLPNDPSVVKYLHDYCEQLADMAGSEYLDDLIGSGMSHKDAQCLANAAVKSAEHLRQKIEFYLP